MIFKKTLTVYRFRSKAWYVFILKPFLIILGTPFLLLSTPIIYLLELFKKVYDKQQAWYQKLLEKAKVRDEEKTKEGKKPRKALQVMVIILLLFVLTVLFPFATAYYLLYVIFQTIWFFGITLVGAFEKEAFLKENDLSDETVLVEPENIEKLLLAKQISDEKVEKELEEHIKEKELKEQEKENTDRKPEVKENDGANK